MFILLLFSLTTYVHINATTPTNNILIRKATPEDLELVGDMAVKAFSKAYNYTSQEQVNALQKTYKALMTEEKHFLNTIPARIALVALQNNNIVGYFSAHATEYYNEIYGRFFVVNSDLQQQGVGKQLLQHAYSLLPATTQQVVCLTNQKNSYAQKLYEHLGGIKVENPAWRTYLYKTLNASEYIGYKFDRTALLRINRKTEEH